MRMARQRPLRSSQLLRRKLRPRLYESLFIEYDTILEPGCAWSRTGHDKHVPDVTRFALAILAMAPPSAFEMIFSLEANHLGKSPQGNTWIVFDPSNEIARHGVCE